MKEEGEDLYRHQCLVRTIIRMRIENRTKAHEFLKLWNKNHPGSRLEQDILDQWSKGSKGVHGDWR